MSEIFHHGHPHGRDTAPGDQRLDGSGIAHGVLSYLLGLALAAGLTVASFYFAGSDLIWRPAIPVALVVLAIAQMGVHLVFFLHITSGPESTNNVLALAFGALICFLVIAGSLWIMTVLNHNMMPMPASMHMQH
ncbi:MAG: cytochrome o ubiquinol oxidase subunit IV [Alphaproteobacteria bacterium]|nr:cytochrome o ubiquinol oxidase subunit IV [Alphaproteobacteria bacterium]MBV9552904.1 cytochrome o ubiquinol oxidase subunit IV [Alphaproteobacteria bacterium]